MTIARRARRAGALLAAAATAALLLAGCSGTSTSSDASADGLTPVSVALDWTPNTNHIGVYVAQSLGYYTDAGLSLDIVPYSSSQPIDLVSAGAADFGFTTQADVQISRTAGYDVQTVFNVTQKETGEIVTLAGNGITSPAQLDGTVFGGFGSAIWTDIARAVIQGDGGTGDFTEVSLDTGAYDALSSGQIAFTESVATWEDLQAAIDGHPYTVFRYEDYGVPVTQTIGIASSEAYLDANPDTAAAFVQATQKGYEYAAEHPEEAAQILIDANPDVLGDSADLVTQSAQLLADEYLVRDGAAVGAANPEYWDDFGAFLLDNGLLVDENGDQVTTAPDWSQYYTDAYLG